MGEVLRRVLAPTISGTGPGTLQAIILPAILDGIGSLPGSYLPPWTFQVSFSYRVAVFGDTCLTHFYFYIKYMFILPGVFHACSWCNLS